MTLRMKEREKMANIYLSSLFSCLVVMVSLEHLAASHSLPLSELSAAPSKIPTSYKYFLWTTYGFYIISQTRLNDGKKDYAFLVFPIFVFSTSQFQEERDKREGKQK
jgi:hypothetical protein